MLIDLSKVSDIHEDDRRKLTAVFNGDFDAKQVKIIETKKACILGNHYHPYRELFYMLRGRGIFFLVDIKTGEKEVIVLLPGERMILGAEIAHKVEMTDNTITIEATEFPYESPEKNDREFKVLD